MKPVVVAAGLSAALLAASIAYRDAQHPLFVWNLTPSAPRGLYWMLRAHAIRRGDFVASQLPPEAAAFASRRGYLADQMPVVKEVIGLRGDTVCAFEKAIYLNGAKLTDRQTHDQLGRAMPLWQGCVVLAPEQVFLALPKVVQSFDGRYFGPTLTKTIEGRLYPIWTF